MHHRRRLSVDVGDVKGRKRGLIKVDRDRVVLESGM